MANIVIADIKVSNDYISELEQQELLNIQGGFDIENLLSLFEGGLKLAQLLLPLFI